MRTFSNSEKEIMRIIARQNVELGVQQNFGTLIGNLFHDADIVFDVDNGIKTVTTDFYSDKYSEQLLVERLISIVLLLLYLESLYLIKLHNTYDIFMSNTLSTIEHGVKKELKLHHQIKDKFINDYICDHWNNSIFVTDELREFVLKDDFKSKQQIQHEEIINETQKQHKEIISKANTQVCLAWGAILIALLTLAITFCSQRTEKTVINKDRKVNEHQLNPKI